MAMVLKSRGRVQVDPTPEQIAEATAAARAAKKRLQEFCAAQDPVNERPPRRRPAPAKVDHGDIESLWWETETARLERAGIRHPPANALPGAAGFPTD
jgi:hypothetical protein